MPAHWYTPIEHNPEDCPLCEAKKLRAENKRLRAALRDCIEALGDGWDCVDKAKAALGGEAAAWSDPALRLPGGKLETDPATPDGTGTEHDGK